MYRAIGIARVSIELDYTLSFIGHEKIARYASREHSVQRISALAMKNRTRQCSEDRQMLAGDRKMHTRIAIEPTSFVRFQLCNRAHRRDSIYVSNMHI